MGVNTSVRLNKQQKEAVGWGEGPLLIIAGAGTGKTTVITERIKHLITSGLAKPSEILALTFTNKAALEMEERVDVAMPLGYTSMWIMTFHSFCDRVLRAEALHIGLDPRFHLMSQAQTIQFVRNSLFQFDLDYFRPLGNPTKFVGGMVEHFSRLQDEDISPQDYLTYAKKLKTEKLEMKKTLELAKAYQKYDELKTKAGKMDYGDLITKTLKLFRDRPNILTGYQKQFKYILVDEFQDTNIAQNELVKLLAGKNANISAVCDDDQSIYKWRGAAVSNVLDFRKTYPKTKIVTLTKNYRSTQEILNRAYDLIQMNNPDRLEVKEEIDKRLQSKSKEKGESIKFFHTDRVENEAEAVAREITKLKVDWQNVAILVRANSHAEPFVRALGRHGIPYQFLGPGRLFKQSEILDLIAYLKVLYDPDDSVALYRLLSIDYFDIPARDLVRWASQARKRNQSLFEILEGEKEDKKLIKLIELIKKHLKLVRRETAGQLLYLFLESTGLIQNLIDAKDIQAEKRAANIAKFFEKLKTHEVDNEDATVPAVVDWLELASEVGESPLAADIDWSDINAVNILTVHSAKGLEFPVVFLVNLVGQRFPTIERSEQIPIPEALIKETLPEEDYHLQEERRLFYVGMTRAKKKLYFTAADYYGEGKREKRLSPFISEALGGEATSIKYQVSSSKRSFLDYKQQPATRNSQTDKHLHVDYLSYSQIETFKTCPLHYKLRYLLNIPTPPSAAMSFGTSLHGALKEFYELVKVGKKPTRNLLLKCLQRNWLNEGYKSKSHEQKMLAHGEGYLAEFLKSEFDAKRLPMALEQSFTVPVGQGLKVGGRIDRIDRLRGGKIEIIDYKTGANVPTQKEVDHDLQLTFYALAATSIAEKPFGVKPQEVKLTLYYFDTATKISTIRSAEQLKAAKGEILAIRAEIEKSDFTCSNHFFCQNCEYKIFCGVD